MDRQNEDEEVENVVGLPLDGGWGWVVTFVCFCATFTQDSISYAFHAVEVPLGRELDVNGSSVAAIMSVFLCLSYIAGPFTSAVANRYGFRFTMVLGSCMGCVGMLFTYYAIDNYIWYICFFGVLSGIGGDMVYVTSLVAVGFWFQKRRATAIGLSTSGTGIAAIVLPFVARYLTKQFGWRIMFVVFSGEFGACALLGFLLKPVPVIKVTNFQRGRGADVDGSSMKQTIIPGHSV